MMNIIANYGVYMGEEKEEQEGVYSLQRAPVTYPDLETALTGLHDYAKAVENTVFLLIDETNEILVKGTRWDGEHYHYATDAENTPVSYLFEHNHEDHNV